jgi:hypothetical protein
MSQKDTATSFPITLPSGKKIVFAIPTFRDRQVAMKRFRQQQNEAGFMLEELLAAMMLVSVNGKPMMADYEYDVIDQISDWAMRDLSFYLEVFVAIAFTDDVTKQRAQANAKALMEGKSQTSVEQPTTITPATTITA